MDSSKTLKEVTQMIDYECNMDPTLHSLVGTAVKCIIKDIPIPIIVLVYKDNKHTIHTQKELLYGLMLFLENKLTVDAKLFNQFSNSDKRKISGSYMHCLETTYFHTDKDIEMMLELHK